jgi:hypothetical protein
LPPEFYAGNKDATAALMAALLLSSRLRNRWA